MTFVLFTKTSKAGCGLAHRTDLICRHNGQFTSFTVNEGCPTTASGHSPKTNGKIFIGTDAGLARFENGAFKTFTAEHGLASNVIQVLCARANGTLLVVTSAGVQSLSSGDSFSN